MTVSSSWEFSKFSVSLQFFWSICVRVGPSGRMTDPAASIRVVLCICPLPQCCAAGFVQLVQFS